MPSELPTRRRPPKGPPIRRRTALVPAALLLLSAHAARGQEMPPQQPVPAVLVQVAFVPGGERPWRRAFSTHVVPAIEAAMKRGEIRGFTYFESIVPARDYDFMLVLRAESFAFFDRPRPYPHWAALFEQVGVEEGRRILTEMLRLEQSVSVSLVREYGADR